MPPVIGIAPCRTLGDYVESVRRAGGDPRILDRAVETPVQALASIRGLLLTGGGDIDPARYGEPRHPSVNEAEAGRDDYELELVTRAMEAELPILALCRGVQVLNVARGGTLVQDIPTQVPGALPHAVNEPRYAIVHEAWIAKGTLLWTLMREKLAEEDTCGVNSRHHQAVARAGQGFDISATAPDGVIEAIERPGARFCLGVQWHPENFWRTGEFRALFEGFIEATTK